MTQVGSGSERRLALVVEYDGTCYQGFQLQHQRPTIQGEIEQALKRFTQVDIRIRGASRTDSGAHAQELAITALGNNFIEQYFKGLSSTVRFLAWDRMGFESELWSSKPHCRWCSVLLDTSNIEA